MVRDLLAPSGTGFLAPKWLLLGCIVGLAGFALVLAVVVSCQIESHQHGVALKECAEYRPFPSTVSELVHHWDSVSGRIFFGLELLAGLAIFMSNFAFCFENCACDCYVYMGPCGCGNRLAHALDLRWCDVRQFVPPMGLLLITLVPTLPANKVTSIHTGIMLALHMVSAFMMFLGVAACEIHFWRRHVVTEVDDLEPDSTLEDGAAEGESTDSPHTGRVRGWTDETDWSERLRTESSRHSIQSPVGVGRAEGETPRETTSLLPHQHRTRYFMGWKEKVLRGAINLCSISCFLAFLGSNGLMYMSDCDAHRYFLRVTGRATCESMRCSAVDTEAVCNDANALFLDHMYQQLRELPEVEELGLPVGYPSESVSNSCSGRSCVRDMPFGCFQRVSEGSTGFIFNKDQTNGVARLPSSTKNVHSVCSCEMGGVAGPLDSKLLKRVHHSALRRATRVAKKRTQLSLSRDQGSQLDVARSVHVQDNQVPLLRDAAKRVNSVSVWGGLNSTQCQAYGIMSFIFEVIAGLSVVSLHLCLWYFCEERSIHQSVRLNTAKHAQRWVTA